MPCLIPTPYFGWLTIRQRLPTSIVALCEDEANDLNVSIASFWELTIKMSLGKITLSEDALLRLSRWCHDNAIRILPIELNHLARLQTRTHRARTKMEVGTRCERWTRGHPHYR